MTRLAVLLILAACSPDTTITVDVDDIEQIASVEVVDQAVWSGESDDGHYDSAEETVLPVIFSVPAGDYTVVVTQGACTETTDVTVYEHENVDVLLGLGCGE